ncbi:MAG: MBL fold metallo-hydrolase [Proteobacteria bacterium]|nr:MBL fold metallo-hydrolase [Pseudomonadota bacterium]
MRIKILFDSVALDNRFSTGWGVSYLVDNKILFDTGEKSEPLFSNMKDMNVNISEMKAVVISHDHWDHTGGLWGILKEREGLNVYICPHFSRELKDKVKKLKGAIVETEKITEIEKGIFVTGEIPGIYKGEYMPEQALIIKTEKGVSVITGCAHPGVLKIVERVRDKFISEPIYFVFGGFHLMESDRRAIEIVAENFKKVKVKKVGPTHCSGKIAAEIFKERYGNDFISIKAGQILDV